MNRLTDKEAKMISLSKNKESVEMCNIYTKLQVLEDIEEEFSNYNIDMTSFLKQVLDELKQQPTLEIKNFNPVFKILRNDFIKIINEYAKVVGK